MRMALPVRQHPARYGLNSSDGKPNAFSSESVANPRPCVWVRRKPNALRLSPARLLTQLTACSDASGSQHALCASQHTL